MTGESNEMTFSFPFFTEPQRKRREKEERKKKKGKSHIFQQTSEHKYLSAIWCIHQIRKQGNPIMHGCKEENWGV